MSRDEIKLLPTPDASVANYAEDPGEWQARADRLKDKGINGNGAGVPLAIAVKRLSRSAPASPASASSTTDSTSPASTTPGSASGTSGAGGSSDSAGPESLFSMTSEGTGETLPGSMSSRAGSRAKARRPRASEKASATPRPFCGETCGGPLTSFDPATSSWRTSPICSDSEPRPPSIDAYAAGLIDGEGCIQVTKKGHARLEMGMGVAALEVLHEMAEEYGGSVRLTRPATEKWQAAHAWSVHGTQAAEALARVYPFLRLKQGQARIAMRANEVRVALIPEGKQNARWTDEARSEVERLRSACMDLNQKGPKTGDAQRAGRLWRKPEGSLLSTTFGEPFSGTWPRSGTVSSGTVFPLRPSAPLTDVTGCSPLLPTPRADPRDATSRKAREGWRPSLMESLQLLPTPRARVDKEHGPNGKHWGELRPVVESLSNGASTSPPSDDGKPSTAPRLSPWFVEWMIGAPPGWSDPDCPLSATEFASMWAISADGTSSIWSDGGEG